MPIREIFKKAVPFEVSYALDCINNKLEYGKPGASVAELLASVEQWDGYAREAESRMEQTLYTIYSRHAKRYLDAAQAVEEYECSKG
jgi:hypothetical protein